MPGFFVTDESQDSVEATDDVGVSRMERLLNLIPSQALEALRGEWHGSPDLFSESLDMFFHETFFHVPTAIVVDALLAKEKSAIV